MPEIIGPFQTVSSTIPALDAHTTHLQHLANQEVSRQILRDRFHLPKTILNNCSQLLSAHVAQALEFHTQSISARPSIRPVLQYYAYLNLAVATIIAYRPPNFEQYRQHGVEDQTHKLTRLEFTSAILKVKRGAVPLFHSIISGEPLEGRILRFGLLTAAIPMLAHELTTAFKKTTQTIIVSDQVSQISDKWRSVISFQCEPASGAPPTRLTPRRIQRAIPLLRKEYIRDSKSAAPLRYRSRMKWKTEDQARKQHRKNCIQMINYGGHFVIPGEEVTSYRWQGVSRIPLMPTLTASLLLAFSLSCMVRYRPGILTKAMSSPINLLIETFVQEADGCVIPAFRNLLYREELSVGTVPYL